MSAQINVRNEVREYPENQEESSTMIVRNHWNNKKKVVIDIGGQSYTFIADHLRKAIDNAQHCHEF